MEAGLIKIAKMPQLRKTRHETNIYRVVPDKEKKNMKGKEKLQPNYVGVKKKNDS